LQGVTTKNNRSFDKRPPLVVAAQQSTTSNANAIQPEEVFTVRVAEAKFNISEIAANQADL
jgi:hypothetical protein